MTPRRRVMFTTAPWPEPLDQLVKGWTYKPGWDITLHDLPTTSEGVGGLRLYITSDTENSLDPKRRIRVRHEFIVPAATYKRSSWLRWLWDRVLDVERHEAGEFFRIDGERVYAPHHGNGENPYITWQIGTQDEADKSAGDD